MRRYADSKDEKAFDELARRYYPLVHRAASTKTENAQLADDVTSAVFILLAKRAGTLGPNVVLAGWLFKAARLTAMNALRAAQAQQKKDAEAAKMAEEAMRAETAIRDHAAMSIVDDGLMTLSERERNALLLRYAQGLTIDETAVTLKITLDAANKRASRGLERLRRYCLHHIGSLGATAIASLLAVDRAAHASPAVLAAPSVLVSNSQIYAIYQGAVKQMLLMKLKTAAVLIGAASIIGVGAVASIHAQEQSKTAGYGNATFSGSLPRVKAVPESISLSYSYTRILKAISPAGRAALIAEAKNSTDPETIKHRDQTVRSILQRSTDQVSPPITVEYWSQDGNQARYAIHGPQAVYSRITDGKRWMSLDQPYRPKPGETRASLLIYPLDRNDPIYRGAMYYAGTIAQDIPFLGFAQPGKDYELRSATVKKTSQGSVAVGKVSHDYALDATGGASLIDAALTFDNRGRLIRLQRDKYQTYDYSDFTTINGVSIPRVVTSTVRGLGIANEPGAIDTQDIYRLKSFDVKRINPDFFTLSNGAVPTPLTVTDDRYERGNLGLQYIYSDGKHLDKSIRSVLTVYPNTMSIDQASTAENLRMKAQDLASAKADADSKNYYEKNHVPPCMRGLIWEGPDNSGELLNKTLDFTLTDSIGKSVALSNDRGNVVILVFWMNNDQGLAELSELQELQRDADAARTPVKTIGVNIDVDMSDRSAVKGYVKEHPGNFPTIFLHEQPANPLTKVNGFPHELIIAKDGTVVANIPGGATKQMMQERIAKYIDSLRN